MGTLLGLIAVAALSQGVDSPVGRGPKMVADYVAAMQRATSLSATVSMQQIGGAPSTYSFQFAKPNKARIETPKQLMIADGTTLTILNKTNATYFRAPETQDGLGNILSGLEYMVWRPFFFPNALGRTLVTRPTGMVTRRGMTLDGVEVLYDPGEHYAVTLFLDPADNIVRQAEFVHSSLSTSESFIVDAKTLAINEAIPSSQFQFEPPANGKQVSLDEMVTDRWYASLDEALAVAARTNKLVLVDFYADW
ncbi:MAG: hypothetical protein HYR64_05590 [Fimbriimonas ginsengisoli]|uniref:Uncharacterized protein n=1 Tax=Fimbriimonas ginsengisoli TaxID=1005039 RepID=A0A931LVP3_FIMGI|nr:hypothetical protein [Fimbriimonas ginsengisoli]